MAYFVDEKDDDEKDAPAAPLAPAVAAPAGPIAATPAPAAGKQGSGQYFNFNRLMDANKGTAQGLASSLAGRAQEAVSRAQSATRGAEELFNKDAEAGSVVPAGPAPGALGTAAARRSEVGSTGAAPFAVAPTYDGPKAGYWDPLAMTYVGGVGPESARLAREAWELEQATAVQPQAYSGPGVGDVASRFAGAQRQVLDARDQLQQLGTFEGRQAALGGSRLDALLAGAAGGRELNAVARTAGDPGKDFLAALTRAGGVAAGAAGTVEARNAAHQAALQSRTDAYNADNARLGANKELEHKELVTKEGFDSMVRNTPWMSLSGPPINYATWQSLNDAQREQVAKAAAGPINDFWATLQRMGIKPR